MAHCHVENSSLSVGVWKARGVGNVGIVWYDFEKRLIKPSIVSSKILLSGSVSVKRVVEWEWALLAYINSRMKVTTTYLDQTFSFRYGDGRSIFIYHWRYLNDPQLRKMRMSLYRSCHLLLYIYLCHFYLRSVQYLRVERWAIPRLFPLYDSAVYHPYIQLTT